MTGSLPSPATTDGGREERLAVVTGASAGIGRALALELSVAGRPVLAIARRADRLADLQREAEDRHGARIHWLTLDVSSPKAAEKVAARARELGRPTLLVNNAGFGVYGRFEAQPLERLGDMVRTNCDALVLLTRALLPDLQASREGMVLNVASVGAFGPMPFMAVYGATKAFVLSFTEALAAEAPAGVRFAALCPGPVDTEFGLVAGTGNRFRKVPGVVTAEAAARVGMGLLRGDAVLAVPGLFNKLALLGNWLLPRPLVRHFSRKIMRPRELGE